MAVSRSRGMTTPPTLRRYYEVLNCNGNSTKPSRVEPSRVELELCNGNAPLVNTSGRMHSPAAIGAFAANRSKHHGRRKTKFSAKLHAMPMPPSEPQKLTKMSSDIGLRFKGRSVDFSPEEVLVALPKQHRRDPLLQLVSLQKASGCWVLDPDLAAALGKTSKEVENTKPASVNQEVWATILALIWLHGFKKDAQEEWELLAMKAVSWLRAQNACAAECVEAGNAVLGCEVQKDALGL